LKKEKSFHLTEQDFHTHDKFLKSEKLLLLLTLALVVMSLKDRKEELGNTVFHGSCSFSLSLTLRGRDTALSKFPDKTTCGVISQADQEKRRKLKSDGVVMFLCQYGSEQCRLGSFPVFHSNDPTCRSFIMIFKACRQQSHSHTFQ